MSIEAVTSVENRIYPENQERTACLEYATVYRPPEELQIPDSTINAMRISESTISSGGNSRLDSPGDENDGIAGDVRRTLRDRDSKSSSTTITSMSGNGPRPLFESRRSQSGRNSTQSSSSDTHTKVPSTSDDQRQSVASCDSDQQPLLSPSRTSQADDEMASPLADRAIPSMIKISTHRVTELPSKYLACSFSDNELSSSYGFTAPGSSDSPANLPQPFPFPKQNRSIERPSVTQRGEQNPYAKVAHRQRELVHQHSVELKANTHSENQVFLKEIVSNVLDGLGIGWLRTNRVKKLMEDENYRNFVLSRLNVNLDKKYSSEDSHIDDVVGDQRSLHPHLCATLDWSSTCRSSVPLF